MRIGLLVMMLIVFCWGSAGAREIAGVDLAEEMTGENGMVLRLNGAGIRTKFFFKIYIAALYLENPQDNAAAIIADTGGKRMVMHFLHSEVGRDDLVAAWNDGFAANGSADQLAALAEEITAFNALFSGVKAGDRIVLDYRPGLGTAVTIRDEQIGLIAGKPFNDLLLSVWLGDKPVTEDLRKALIGS